MEENAADVLRRANKLQMSISQLCRQSGVSRSWFERMKFRVPKAVVNYIKVNNVLQRKEMEKKQKEVVKVKNLCRDCANSYDYHDLNYLRVPILCRCPHKRFSLLLNCDGCEENFKLKSDE